MMNVDVALWIFGPVSTIFAAGWAVTKAFSYLVAKMVAQFEKRLDERFEALEEARAEGRKIWEERIARLDEKQERTDRELREMLISMPDKYVRREDYVRRETVIEAKIDQLSLRIQNWILENKHV
jgi:hypothetical protein